MIPQIIGNQIAFPVYPLNFGEILHEIDLQNKLSVLMSMVDNVQHLPVIVLTFESKRKSGNIW